MHYENFINNLEVKMGQEENILAAHDSFAFAEQYGSAFGTC